MSNLVDNPEEYFRKFLPKREQLLIELEEEAQREDIPIVGPIVGDAQEKLAEMDESFDFIFIDIDKENYAAILPHCHRMLKQDGLLVADNVGFKDADPFNRLISESSEWRSVSLFAYLPFHSPERDGLCLAVRL